MALSVELEKRLGSFRLQVQFETGRELMALLGASGSGKSVTLRCVAGLLRPDRGRIVLNGRTLYDSAAGIDLPPRQRRVGYLFQSCALFPDRTVLQNVMLGYHHRPRRDRRALALEQLERFRLSHLAGRLPDALSGGERQRVALARTLAAEPEALLLDEPFSALDEHLKWQLELELLTALEQYGGDAVLVTHSTEELRRLARTVCVLTEGRSEPPVPVERMLTAPQTLGAARLSGCENLSPALCLPEGGLSCTAWGWRLPALPLPEGLTHVGIRAASLRPGAGEIGLCCSVERVIDNAGARLLLLRGPGPELLRMELPKEEAPPLPGAAWTVHVAPEDILLLKGGAGP